LLTFQQYRFFVNCSRRSFNTKMAGLEDAAMVLMLKLVNVSECAKRDAAYTVRIPTVTNDLIQKLSDQEKKTLNIILMSGISYVLNQHFYDPNIFYQDD